MKAKSRSLSEWNRYASQRMKKILAVSRAFPSLKKMGPKADWSMEIHLVGAAKMIELNTQYRGKNYATDVLSFPASEPFLSTGWIGELVICLPTLKKQAKTLHLKPEQELDVLITHGILHLLGMDHELGEEQSRKMARWEVKILEIISPKALKGLIDRTNSGIESK